MKTIFLFLFAGLMAAPAFSQVYNGDVSSASIEQKLNDEYCSGLFHSTHGTIIDVASNPSVRSYQNILDWLPGRVAGLQVYSTRTGTSIPVIRGGVPAIFVDEMQVNAQFLNMLNINDIAIVKIIKTPFPGGFNGGYGAIAVYTFGDEEDEEE